MGGPEKEGQGPTVPSQFELQGNGKKKTQLQQRKKNRGKKDQYRNKVLSLMIKSQECIEDWAILGYAHGFKGEQWHEYSWNIYQQAADWNGKNLGYGINFLLIQLSVAAGTEIFFSRDGFCHFQQEVTPWTSNGSRDVGWIHSVLVCGFVAWLWLVMFLGEMVCAENV